MSVVAEWKNDAFALALCDRLPFNITQPPPLAALEHCPCLNTHCDSEIAAGDADVCSVCDAAPAWVFHWFGEVIALSHDGTTDSCRFVDRLVDPIWELDISAGTLTKDGTIVWTAFSAWRCLMSNAVSNPEPGPGIPRYLCISPIPIFVMPTTGCEVRDIANLYSCPLLVKRYAVEMELTENPAPPEYGCVVWANPSGGWPLTVVLSLVGRVDILGENARFYCGWGGGTEIGGIVGVCGINRFFILLGLPQFGSPEWGNGKVYARISVLASFFGAVGGARYVGDFSCTGTLTLSRTFQGWVRGCGDCDFPETLEFVPT